MGSDKILHNKSSEELLKMLEEMGEQKTSEPQVSDETLNFINTYNLLPGNNKVKATLLYKLYNKFVQEKVSKQSFMVKMGQYLTHVNGDFMLNVQATNIGTSYHKQLEATKRDVTKSKKFQKKFNSFLEEYEVEPGGYFTPWYALYYIFQLWCREKGYKVRLGPVAFRRTLNIIFTKKNLDNTGPWYGVNDKIKGTYLDAGREKEIQQWYETQKNWHPTLRYKIPST